MTVDIAEVLEKAADDIATNGLAKHLLQNGNGQRCAIGAIGCALGYELLTGAGFIDNDAWEDPSIEDAAAALSTNLPPALRGYWPGSTAWNQVVLWNNHPDRTADEVVEAMRHAAKDFRNEVTP